ncbi:hypothetical protein [Anaerocolumna xylanovorans]|uniref:Peptidase family M50 n=1 Tax=Anaerocolumna xylanovorans DSM 12503 TaxID=1121345 RepID=A0A1M7YLW1_9FIRM|nr:hypothetical protein [Anaerocolumna xylanovorans]SHO53600.1 hypothetical protein SAMN02745217_04182 [Anaerocolumna xylanovorans DSM 12503]
MRIQLIRLLAAFLAGCIVMILHEFPKALLYNSLNKKQDPKKKKNIYKLYQYIDPIGILFCVTNQAGFSKPYMYRLKNRRSNLLLGICGFVSLFLVFAASVIIIKVQNNFSSLLEWNPGDGSIRLFFQFSLLYMALISITMFFVNLFPVSTFDMGLCIAAKSPSRYFSIIKNDYLIKVLLIFVVIFQLLTDISWYILTLIL